MLSIKTIFLFFSVMLLLFSSCQIKSSVKIKDLKISEADSLAAVQKLSKSQTPVDTAKFYPVNSKDTLQPIYANTAEFLWKTYVPKSGQAKTQQGELIRILEKIDNEIRGNGKGNWYGQFTLLANTLRDSLIASKIFSKEIEKEIENDIDILTDETTTYTADDVYDRLTRRIVEWYWRHKEPVKHLNNPKLKI